MEIESMVSEKKSLNEISRTLSLSKSTAYYWFRRFGGHTVPKVRINYDSEENIGELVGIFAGDGNYYLDSGYRHIIKISLNIKDSFYSDYVYALIEKTCNKKPWKYQELSHNVTAIRIISKELINLLEEYLDWGANKTLTVHLRQNLEDYGRDFVIGFLRGLMDTDGYLGNKIAKYTTISFPLARNVEKLLKTLGISSKGYVYYEKRENRHPIYRIVISKDFDKLISTIKPKHFNHLSTNK